MLIIDLFYCIHEFILSMILLLFCIPFRLEVTHFDNLIGDILNVMKDGNALDVKLKRTHIRLKTYTHYLRELK